MKSHNRSNALLVELLIVVMFFMLSSTVLLRVFAASRTLSDKAAVSTRALNRAQNIAEMLYSGKEPDELDGFSGENDFWSAEFEGYSLCVSVSEEITDAGSLRNYAVSGTIGAETLFTLPVARYTEAEP
ncbi:MAG: hypothetical protein IKR85_02015 [Clostridia bacterium]|nr:hypothetical protein [Clostridia bacterium]